MTNVRVYEVAKELGLDNRDLVHKISALGIQVRNHMSSLDPLDVDRIKRALEKDKADNLVEERIRPTVVRRRTVVKAGVVTSGGNGGQAAGVHELPAAAAAPAQASTPAARAPSSPAPAPSLSTPAPSLSTPAPSLSTPVPAPRRPSAPSSAPASTLQGQAESSRVRTPVAPAAGSDGLGSVAREEPRLEESVERPSSVPPPEGPPEALMLSPSELPPASVRLGHANLPPGVVARGSAVAPGAAPLSDSARSRILNEHALRRPSEAPRRRELGRAALGPAGRPQARPTRRKMAPGKKGLETKITVPSAQKRVIRIEDQVQLQALAHQMSLKATDVLMKLMQLGMASVHINSTLDADTAKILASEFGYEVENVARSDQEIVESARGEFKDEVAKRAARPPIVTVMGHVDHGKTSLLDRIRKANVAAGEAGGITQHVGAYRVDTDRGTIVFLDTPGHEAFTAMRARGASATDIVVLVVAADDGVMPQTKEAVNHARAAKVPIVVAINKMDKAGAKPEVIRRELANEGIQPEDWGGDTMFVEVSAGTGQGVDKLLEILLLQSEMLELRANPEIPAEGVVLEAYLDKGRGPVANVLVRNGTLRIGDHVVAGASWGRIRAMSDDRGGQIREALPSTPVEILGLSEMPSAGDLVYAVTDPKKAQEVAGTRKPAAAKSAAPTARGLDQIYQMMQAGDTHELKLVIKADVQGSVEALVKAMTDLSTEKVKVNVIHTGVGGITENDVMLASASAAIIVGFNVRPAGQASATAKTENVDVRMYRVIYEAVDEVKKAMAGLLAPKLVQKESGKAEVRQVFNLPKTGTVAGCFVTEGKIVRSGKVRVVRDSVHVWEGAIASIRRFKEDVRDVAAGYECGITLAGYNDVKERDVLECFEVEEVAATLE